ncbi:conserved membrane hypothetical protein [Tenacibaculum amylolyticum]
MKSIKYIFIGIISFIIGITIAVLSYSFFRTQIQNIFLWSTSNQIRFIGKNFYFFASNFYYISFGITFLYFSINTIHQEIKIILKNIILRTLIFIVFIILISSLYANLKVIECTACENGIRSIHWNEINYDFILGISILSSNIISIIDFIKSRKKTNQHERNHNTSSECT